MPDWLVAMIVMTWVVGLVVVLMFVFDWLARQKND